jgi:murein L,D-transpeptidase YafK
LNRSPLVRALLASAALAAAVALAGCDTDGTSPSGRALAPLSSKTLAEIEQKNMTKESPILVRIFKEEAELEVWKQDRTGHFALLKSYPICRWSGDLGPKIKEGDRQAPEGFYTITPAQMNPNSQYFLAINTGFPNTYDQANGRTGNFLMIHGDCSSRGCYAMTDEQISEIYALGRESFFGGQNAFQVQAFPFHMTPANMAKHRNNPNMPFWKMIKEGYDHFEVTRHEPKVDVCERRYVFNAAPPANSSTPLNFSPRGQCPVYQLPEDIVAAVTDKKRRDEIETAELINRGTPTAPVKLATDGGMHPVFVAAIQGGRPVKDADGEIRALIPVTAPGKIPANVTPPPVLAVASADTETATVPLPRAAPRQPARIPTRTAYTDPAPPPSGNFLNSLFASNGPDKSEKPSSPGILDRVSNMMGLRGSDTAPAEAQAPAPKPTPAAKPAATMAAGAIRPKPQPMAEPVEPPTRTASAGAIRPPSKPAEQNTDAAVKPPASASLLSGAAPVIPTGSFGTSWSALR